MFQKTEQGEKLIEDMQEEIDNILQQRPATGDAPRVFYMVSGLAGSPRTTGKQSLDGHLIELAGGDNIFADVDGYLATVSWEEIAARNPDVIVLSYCCGTHADDLKNNLLAHPAMQAVNAVKNNRYVEVEVEEMTGSMRVISGLEKLIKGFYP